MKPKEAIELLENLKVCKQAHILFNVEKEAVDLAIEALHKVEKLEYMINVHKQKGRSPHYTVTMEDLSYLIDMKEGEEK